MDTTSLAVGVVAAAALGLGLWCLADEENPIGDGLGGKTLDYKETHTLEKLQ